MIHCSKCNQNPCTCMELETHDYMPCSEESHTPVDLFGSPFNCRKQIPTKRFPSPNSPLPKHELDELQACIEAVNDLLRSLGTKSNPNNTRQLQQHLFNFKGLVVKAHILCGNNLPRMENDKGSKFELDLKLEKKEKILKKKGKLATAGRDFIQLNQVGSALFVLYEHLLSITRDECEVDEHGPEFLDADSLTRRELAFNFGEFVSKNPDLVNLFFGIRLYVKLKEFLGSDVKVKTDKCFFYGTLIKTEEGKIQIESKIGKTEVDLKEICYVEVLNLK